MTETPTDDTPPHTQAATDLREICRQAGELTRTAAGPPQRISIRSGELHVELEWPRPASAGDTPSEAAPAGSAAPTPPAGRGDDARTYVLAPMVGTFYHAREPGAAPFIRPGDLVEPGRQVGILEAMKLMNAIEAGTSGRVEEILVPDGTPVEYGRPLVALTPDRDRN
ncbi:acetyl-CoA carboxylase biotin carboxyl carrier protein [Nocardiopsis sediminis]|uniref:Biotin carboxyl carrier protein of acetyl-CoA carboxylase n=1 Tax=Nocardiopsis sediminis TaxID=1778267 RepID=A0ABV8FQP1_9ACTN